RARRQRPDTERTRHRNGLPELCALSAHDGRAEPRLRAEAPEVAEEGDRRACPAGCADPEDRGIPEAKAARTFRRSAPAGGHGPRDRARAAGVPDGRAALEP